jgi:hypothetical protein
LLATQTNVTLSPEFSTWSSIASTPKGELFGKSLHYWQSEVRNSMGITTVKPVVIVGHQPTFFHPGILAKFIAAHRLAQLIDGELVYLVVDYHKGDAGMLQTPSKEIELALIDPTIAMNEQPRVQPSAIFEPFSTALEIAEGQNVAMQFANALVQLMTPYSNVHHVIPASALLQTTFGEAILSEMQLNPHSCIESYNSAVQLHPSGRVPFLHEEELPIWDTGERVYPRAMLLTLLARLVCCDLFVHGIGGTKYDQAMEHWCNAWLHCQPCRAVLSTANLQLKTNVTTVTDARRRFSSPPFGRDTKSKFLNAIEQAPYKSPQRQSNFQKMHQWLSEVQPPLDFATLRRNEKLSKKRDWAFPLYPNYQLQQLHDDINAM